MKYKILKIRKRYLNLVRKNIKKHEYRLSAPKYDDLVIGDVLILQSNQNKYDYEKVEIKSIKKYKTWEEALDGRWKNDFFGLFDNFIDVLKECHRFYTRNEVELYGITVYEIDKIKKKINNSLFLLDTNIIVQRESGNNVSSEVVLTYKMIDKIKGIKYIHPKTIDELSQYQDKNIKESMLIKIKAYNVLTPQVGYDNYFLEVVNQYAQDMNSKIDNEILFQAYSGKIDYLITEDQGILSKAKKLFIDDMVISPFDFLNLIEEKYPALIDYNVLKVKKIKIGSLNINDCFFDSLREDYDGPEFNKWLNRKNDEEAYVFENSNGLQGFLYLKTEDETENYSHFEPILTPKKRLKVGTFKINSTGLRLGERFLKIIFDNAKKRNVDEIYVTLFDGKREEVKHLKELMEDWGFEKKGINKKSGEIYMIKDFKNYNISKSPKYNFPLINNPNFLFLPIYSQYHTRLLPDLFVKGEFIKVYEETAYRYAVEKIYITKWNPKSLPNKPGDVLFIYRMGDYYKTYTSVVTGISILNEIKFPRKEEDFIKECNNRSVFTEQELRCFYRTGKYKTIIKVLYLDNFNNKVNLKSMIDNGILKERGPRLNTMISKKQAEKLLKLGGKDD